MAYEDEGPSPSYNSFDFFDVYVKRYGREDLEKLRIAWSQSRYMHFANYLKDHYPERFAIVLAEWRISK